MSRIDCHRREQRIQFLLAVLVDEPPSLRVQLVQAQQTNAYWMAQISNDQVDPRSIDAVRSLVPDLNGVTPADLQSLARTYLKDDTAWKLVALPEGAAP